MLSFPAVPTQRRISMKEASNMNMAPPVFNELAYMTAEEALALVVVTYESKKLNA